MSVKRRGAGWQIDFKKPDGTRYRKIHPARSEDEALFIEQKLRRDFRLGRAPTGGITLREACERALTEHYAQLKDRRGAEINIDVLYRYLDPATPLVDIDSNALSVLVQQMRADNKSGATINRKLSTLQKVMRLARDQWEAIPALPRFPKQPESVGRVRILTPEEEHTVLDILRDHDRSSVADLIVFLVDTGCRLGEALLLGWRDVSLKTSAVSVWENKASHPRTVPLTTRVRQVLADRRAEMGLVFHDVTKDRAERAWRHTRHLMGLDADSQFVIHALRHTCASRLVQRGVELYTVKTWLGHKSITTTERYAHLNTGRLMQAAQALEEVVPAYR